MVRLIKSFPVVLKYHLTIDGCNYHLEDGDGVLSDKEKENINACLKRELDVIFGEDHDEVERLMAASHRPLYVLSQMSSIVDAWGRLPATSTSPIYQQNGAVFHTRMEQNIERLTGELSTRAPYADVVS